MNYPEDAESGFLRSGKTWGLRWLTRY